jgi:hypothetical protein
VRDAHGRVCFWIIHGDGVLAREPHQGEEDMKKPKEVVVSDGMKWCVGYPFKADAGHVTAVGEFGKDAQHADGLDALCRECKTKKNTSPTGREAMRKYKATPKAHETDRKWRTSPAGRESQRKHNATPAAVEARRQYAMTPAGREAFKRASRMQQARYRERWSADDPFSPQALIEFGEMKRCWKCCRVKPRTREFWYRDSMHTDGIDRRCIACREAAYYENEAPLHRLVGVAVITLLRRCPRHLRRDMAKWLVGAQWLKVITLEVASMPRWRSGEVLGRYLEHDTEGITVESMDALTTKLAPYLT